MSLFLSAGAVLRCCRSAALLLPLHTEWEQGAPVSLYFLGWATESRHVAPDGVALLGGPDLRIGSSGW